MKQRSAKSKKKNYSQIFGIAVSLLLAVAVISSAVFLHESHYFNSSESHVLEVLRGMDGKSEVRSWDDDRNLKRRETLLQKGCADNPDMIGWLVLPQTMIDYPLMGGTDSNRYTDHNYEGGYDLYGTPFLDSRNAVDFSDFFSLVFGHDMNNSAMFGSLDDFLQESAFADLSDGVLLLPDERYRLEVTASIAATCPAQELIDQIMTADAAEQPQLLEQLLEMAAVKKDDVTVSEEDHWVMLSTLDYADEKNDNGTPSMLLLKLETSTT